MSSGKLERVMSKSFSSLRLSEDDESHEPKQAEGPVDPTAEAPESPPAPTSQRICQCSFCGLGDGRVARLFQGRAGYICDECVDVCIDLLADYQLHAIPPPEIKRSWRERWFGETKTLVCGFTPHTHDNQQGERFFCSTDIQICDHCIRQCALLKSNA